MKKKDLEKIYSEQNRLDDFYWFVDNYYKLYEQHGRKWFVIRHKKILGIFDNISTALKVIEPTYPIGTFILQNCTGDESGYTAYIN